MLEFTSVVFSVVRYELRRARTPIRAVTWIMLAAFPIALMWLARQVSRQDLPIEVASVTIYLLVPQVTCVLAMLMWATPTIQSEVEGQTWIYVALRPHGRPAIVIGKYIVSVIFAASAGCTAAIGSAVASGVDDVSRLASSICALVLLSSLCYGAMYSLLGTLLYRRAMVMAVAFTLFIELVLSIIPATINKLTISYRLRSLLTHWLPLRIDSDAESLFASTESTTAHIVQLFLYVGITLTLAVITAHLREYPVGGEPS